VAWTEREAEDYLLGLELFGMRFGLERMHRLTTMLGMPQRRFAEIHVVGSNGKSSTVRFIAAILERHGLRTASYTSPHLRRFRERIEVGERPIPPERFAAAVERVAEAAAMVDSATDDEDDRVTQFEALTAAAFHELATADVEVAVIEAGLGGRYDATNVIPSSVQVLTAVSLEHTRWLGSTIAEIAGEKLAVVRDYSTLIVAPDLHPEAHAVAEQVCAERHADLISAPAELDVELLAPGDFQRRNFALAAAAAIAFLGRAPDLEAIYRAATETRIAGRLDVVAGRPLTVFDGAHNPAGIAALAHSLPDVVGDRRPLVLVISVLDDKDAGAMLSELLPLADRIVVTRCSNPRAAGADELAGLVDRLEGSPEVEVVGEPAAALERARALAGERGAVLATGSIYLIADLVRETGDTRVSTL
jgi:dihydrofolate synthase / folylpolyglutamate synthase